MSAAFSGNPQTRESANPQNQLEQNNDKPAYLNKAKELAQASSKTSQRRKSKQSVDPLAPQSSTPIRKSSSQLNPRQTAIAAGTSVAKPLKPDALVPSRILWASEASWLSSAVDQLAAQRNTAEVDEDDTMMAGAKVVYFVHNDLRPDNIESLLRTLGAYPTDTLKFAKICDEYQKRRSKWQGAIISFIEAVVANAVVKWIEQHPADNFLELSEEDRQAVWNGSLCLTATIMALASDATHVPLISEESCLPDTVIHSQVEIPRRARLITVHEG